MFTFNPCRLLFNFMGEDHFILVYGFHIHYIFAGTIEFKNRGYKMSLEAVIEYFSEYNMDHRVMVLENPTATVEELEKYSNCKEWVDVCKYD